jgi:hypothetical protein
MTLPETPDEKLAVVKEAYLLRIASGIQRVYEKTNQVRCGTVWTNGSQIEIPVSPCSGSQTVIV